MAEDEAKVGTSELPEDIIQGILSFLPTIEAAQTTLVSKAWLSAWKTCPTLSLDLIDYQYMDQENRYQRRVGLFDYVNRILLRYQEKKISIQRFMLRISIDPQYHRLAILVKRWIQIAAENGLRELKLMIHHNYSLPQNILEAKSLVNLHIRGSYLLLQVPEKILCHRLQRLNLEWLHLDEVMFQKIISSCPLIEYLNLSSCSEIKKFKVTKLLYLKHLSISIVGQDPSLVEVEAPSIEYFACNGDSHWWSKPCGLTLGRSQNLKCLTLHNVAITDRLFWDFKFKFPNLENLKMHNCGGDVQSIKITSCTLKSVDFYFSEDMKELEIDDTRSIVQFKYTGSSIPHSCFTGFSSKCESEIFIRGEDVDTSWFNKLKEFLAKLVESKISLNLVICGDVSFKVERIKDNLASPEPHAQQLMLYIDRSSSSSVNFSSLLDGVFWTCRPKTIGEFWTHDHPGFTRFICKKLLVKRNKDYHHSRKIKFWQENLKEVKVDICEWEWEPGPSDYDTVLNMLFGICMAGVRFHLEWQRASQD